MTTPSPDLQRVALQAVAAVAAEYPGDRGLIRATKIVYDQEGCGLLAARDAVRWALANPLVTSLPAGSVVATATAVFIKLDNTGEPTLPWSGTTDGMYTNLYGNDEIGNMLQSGEATILRIGGGS